MRLGIDRIEEVSYLFEGKRVGLITNPTGVNSILESTIDVLKRYANLVSLFSPEHGVRGNIQAGETVETYVDEKTGCTVYSLYGKTKRPTKEMLDTIDVLAIDIQDIGSRFYTYIYTISFAMERCKEYGKPVIVFDRPNPIGGETVEGNLLNLEYRSFIGYYSIPQRYGLTIGELAKLFNEEFGIGCDLTVVEMEGWRRSMYWPDTKLHWLLPSPNIPTFISAVVYNATCVFEGTNVSEGRGTTKPFEIIGAPYIDPDRLADEMNAYELKGVRFRPIYFTPTFSKHQGTMCGGVELLITDYRSFETVKTGWTLFYVIRKLYPKDFSVIPPYKEGMKTMLEYNTGDDYLINLDQYTLDQLMDILNRDQQTFQLLKTKYHLYE